MISIQRLYEASLLQRWYITRNTFYMQIYKSFVENSVFMDKPLTDFYAKTVDPYQHLTITEMQSLFFMTIYLLSICLIVFMFECVVTLYTYFTIVYLINKYII